ncbi:MAG: patatin family protein [Bacilli bacterium]|nr:patatin family protein [Bacilli bacterium]
MKKTILVLEGGGLRGIYTAGVLDVLLENHIQVDAVVGVSAGALFGINYISKQKGRVLRYNLDNLHNKHYMGLYSLITTGNIMNKDFCFDTLVHEKDPFDFHAFQKSKIKFYCVVTNVETGKPEYIEIKDLENQMEYLRASGSMPIVSKMVEIDGKKYLDGGISDSVPIEWAIKKGYDRIIVVETRMKEYRKKEKSIFLFQLFYRKYPQFLSTIQSRPKEYNKTKKYIVREDKKSCFVIRPSRFIKIKRVEKNKKKILEMYQLGVEDTHKCMNLLKDYLK